MCSDILSVLKSKITQNKFLLVSLGLAVLGAAFHFWMAYPGFLNDDGYELMLGRINLQPVVMGYFFSFLFYLFGYHVWYGLFLIIFPFYLGMWLIVYGFYQRYKSWWALIGFFPMFIQTIFISLFFILSVAFEASYSFLLYACLLYVILAPAKKTRIWLIFLMGLCCIICVFARHNGIVQILPAVACGIYLFLYEKHQRNFLLKYFTFNFLALLFLCSIKLLPQIVFPSQYFIKPHQHMLAHQLAAMCVPEDDATCFDKSWFLPGKGFEDVKQVYERYPFVGDRFGFSDVNCGLTTYKIKAEGIEKKWLQAILKYPANFIRHEIEMMKLLWTTPIQFVEYSPQGPKSPFYETFNFYEKEWRTENFSKLPVEELYMHETPLKKQLLHLWDDYLPKVPTLIWIFYMVITGILSSVLLFINKKIKSLFYCFHLSWGGLVVAVLYGMFYPNLFWRYIGIIWVFGVGITLGLSIYVLDSIKERKNYELA